MGSKVQYPGEIFLVRTVLLQGGKLDAKPRTEKLLLKSYLVGFSTYDPAYVNVVPYFKGSSDKDFGARDTLTTTQSCSLSQGDHTK